MRIDRVYTKGGDKGETSLIGGDRVPKSDRLIEAYGTIDEVNATIGLVVEALATSAAGAHLTPILRRVQNELFNLGCELATPDAERRATMPHVEARHVADFTPDEAAVEATFVNRDAAATLKLGQARGIAMLVPAIAGLAVAEYAPNLVKKTIVGAGHCEKAQIRMMVGVLLPKADPQSDDAADALAIAVTHAHHRQSAVLKVAAR